MVWGEERDGLTNAEVVCEILGLLLNVEKIYSPTVVLLQTVE